MKIGLVNKKLIIALVLMTVSLSAGAEDLVLTIEPPTNAIHVGDYPHFTATITNRGLKLVTLVQPGDGSESKWRTPFIAWSVLPADVKTSKHPIEPLVPKGLRFCGNINSIKLSEIFALKPGESKHLQEWIGHPTFEKPGRYSLVFYYQNIPDLKILGVPLGPDEDGAVGRMRNSTPCRLVSNEITVTVLPKGP